MAFPVDIQFVKSAEAKLDLKLPLGYVVKMCRENGGSVTTDTVAWFLFPIFDDTDRTRLKRTCNDIIRETESACSRPGFPPDALAIGDNACGDRGVVAAKAALATDQAALAAAQTQFQTALATYIADLKAGI